LIASAAAQALQVLFELHAEKENEYIVPALAQEMSVSLADALADMHRNLQEIKDAQAGGCGGACGCGGHAGSAAANSSSACACGGRGRGPDAGNAGGCACGAHDHVTEEVPAPPAAAAACGCGGHDEPGRPVLDARAVPHKIRHATVFGALDAIRPGSGLELIAPHDPLPLLAQIEKRNPGVFEISYLERGPQDWRLAIDRVVSA
jgi:uncharacterized protein (DUF2249 family)